MRNKFIKKAELAVVAACLFTAVIGAAINDIGMCAVSGSFGFSLGLAILVWKYENE